MTWNNRIAGPARHGKRGEIMGTKRVPGMPRAALCAELFRVAYTLYEQRKRRCCLCESSEYLQWESAIAEFFQFVWGFEMFVSFFQVDLGFRCDSFYQTGGKSKPCTGSTIRPPTDRPGRWEYLQREQFVVVWRRINHFACSLFLGLGTYTIRMFYGGLKKVANQQRTVMSFLSLRS